LPKKLEKGFRKTLWEKEWVKMNFKINRKTHHLFYSLLTERVKTMSQKMPMNHFDITSVLQREEIKNFCRSVAIVISDHLPDVRKIISVGLVTGYWHSGLPEPLIVERTGGVAVELLKPQASEKFVSERQRNDFGTISERPQVRRPLGGTDK
jgi:hypothetical protein